MTTQTMTTRKRPSAINLLGLICRSLAVSYERLRQRQTLAMLTDTQLKDIGLTRGDVAQETAKPVWRG